MLSRKNSFNNPLAAMLSCSGLELTGNERRLFERCNPLGVTLFSRNIDNKEQVTNLIASIKKAIGRDNVIIAVDQEGGRVRRLLPPHFRAYTSTGKIYQITDEKKRRRAFELHAQLISQELREVGFNLNYAPVLDIPIGEMTEALAGRTCGDTVKDVCRYGKVLADTYMKSAICPCIKHIPGHGRAKVDPHLELPVVDAKLSEIIKTDIVPFKHLSEAPMAMTAHIVIEDLCDKPVTISRKGINFIRNKVGFDGFLVSDAINMKALKGSVGVKTRSCLEAGCDAVLYCFGKYEEMVEVIKYANPLSEESMQRLNKVNTVINRKVYKEDIKELEKEYYEIIGSVDDYFNDYDSTEILYRMKEAK